MEPLRGAEELEEGETLLRPARHLPSKEPGLDPEGGALGDVKARKDTAQSAF